MKLEKVKLLRTMIVDGEVKNEGDIVECLPEFKRYALATQSGAEVEEKLPVGTEVRNLDTQDEVIDTLQNREQDLKLSKKKK